MGIQGLDQVLTEGTPLNCIRVAPVLHEFEGVLTGTPHFTGQSAKGALLLERTEPDDVQRR
jgi:hypothetical protein